MDHQENLLGVIETTLQRILVVVGHSSEEAGAISQALLMRIMQVTLTYLVAQKEEYKEVIEKLKDETDTTVIMQTMLTHVSLEQFKNALRIATTDIMSLYFQEMSTELSSEQKDRIAAVVEESSKTMNKGTYASK